MAILIAQAQATQESSEGSASVEPFDLAAAYDQYNGNAIASGVAALIAIAFAIQVVRNVQSVSRYGVGLDRRIRRRLRAFEKQGAWGSAGDLLFQHEKYSDAAELFEQGKEWLRAGEAYEKAGQTPKAASMFRKGSAPVMAAEALARRGQFSSAAKEFQTAGLHDRAAENFLKALDYRAAADIYAKVERFNEAGDCYSRAGEKSLAAAFWKKHFDAQFDLVRGDLTRIPEVRELAARAADVLDESGSASEAAQLLHKAGYLKRAAELYTRLGLVHEAAAVYLEANKPMHASRLYESVGEHEKALQYRAEARLLKNDSAGAAEDFAAAGEFVKAAEIYVQANELGPAALMYEKAGEHRTAAELYKTEGSLQAAATAYEHAADYTQAADLYGELGDHTSEIRVAKAGNDWFRVGEVLLRYERDEDALAAFQRVDAMDPRYETAAILQADILRKLGRLDVALNKYREIVRDQRPTQANVEIFYKMAGTAVDSNALGEALSLYEKIIGVNYYYKDANKLAAELRSHVGSAAGSAPPVRPGTVVAGAPPQAEVALARNNDKKRYTIEEEVARGGMGIVYRARDTVLDRVVAYKILTANLKENEVAVKYFLREARAAAQMAHQNIVTVYDAGEQDGEFYMAMEFVEGQTLKALINRQGAFPEKLVRYIMIQVCKGLAYAHDRGLVHRDVKPGNIMLTRDRQLKIMDFGLAKFVEEVNVHNTRAIGTPYYMSPEQIVGRELDGRSDIYSLGVSIFECATGQVPFSKGDLSYHHLHTVPPNPLDLNPRLSQDLVNIILKCMEKEPGKRFASVHELLGILRSEAP